jgi:threonine synthase
MHTPDARLSSLRTILTSESISDTETVAAIRELHTQHHYLPDPHGAVGYLALKRYLTAHPGNKGIFLETAHPVKFYDTVEPIIGKQIPLPDVVSALINSKKQSKKITARYSELKEFLVS